MPRGEKDDIQKTGCSIYDHKINLKKANSDEFSMDGLWVLIKRDFIISSKIRYYIVISYFRSLGALQTTTSCWRPTGPAFGTQAV